MKIHSFQYLITSLLLISCLQSTMAQNAESPATNQTEPVATLTQQLQNQDKDIVSSIAPYDSATREAILTASEAPQLLARISRMQAQTSQQFQDLIQSHSQREQDYFYQVARYPQVVHTLAGLGKGSSETSVKAMVEDQNAKEALWNIYHHHFADLVKIDQMNQNAAQAFDQLTASYSPATQNAFNKLIDMPEVLTLLTDHMDLTMQLEDSFKADPEQVRNHLAELHTTLQAKNQQEVSAYRQQLESDPQALQELQKSSKEFAADNHYAYTVSDTVIPNAATTTNYYYGVSPYSYWFGYPYWYDYALWYPMPLYMQTGFYFGAGGNLMVFGLPSFAYSNWFFTYGYHRYPALYHAYGNFYHQYAPRVPYMPFHNAFWNVARNHYVHNPVAPMANRTDLNRRNFLPQHQAIVPQGNVREQPLRSGRVPAFENSSRMDHFRANESHAQAWGSFRGGQGFSGGFGGGFAGGGFHGGGFHGGGRH
ncbi:hypothetical protein [Xanthocytophaga agilis]|uniref:DUF3300 domain-containing protein n=1 Tax=Xanthocytophaga agilis TaxID=3048010 RepID=A0AAE3R0R8_9BACT|nr:hypothetical protein [Xanthocytophaga agilis]MDJ1501561.1 hypothetical protein [Xanthocytophaga agilis]